MARERNEIKLDNGNTFYIRRYDVFLSLKILGEVQKRPGGARKEPVQSNRQPV